MTRADRRPRRLAVALLLAGALSAGLAGCSDPAPAQPVRTEPATKPEVRSYVALGDSYTAAPLVPVTDVADGCFRSDSNYPALVAARLHARLTDVSCSGADTTDVTGSQEITIGGVRSVAPPQIRAVRPGTDLVTVGIGGNDENLFKTLVETCTVAAGASCADGVREALGDPDLVLATIGRNVTRVLRAVQRRAPGARVLLVGYPRLVDEDRSCRAMPTAAEDRPVLAGLETGLSTTLEGAADRAGAGYIDMHDASEGHEVCSPDPWVNGRTTDQQRAAAFHPFAEGQDAVADRIMALLSP